MDDESGIRLLECLVMIYGPVIMLFGRSAQRPSSSSQGTRQLSPAVFKRQRLLMRMATYRPLAVLASIWVVLLAIALLAYGQLLRTAPDANQRETPLSTEVYPHERLSEDSETTDPAPAPDTPEVATEASAPDETNVADGAEATTAANSQTGMNIWTLLALVGTCAVGTWLLSVQLKKPPKVKVAKSPSKRQRSVKLPMSGRSPGTQLPHPHPATSSPLPPKAPQRLGPYDPQTPLVQPPAQSQPQPSASAPAARGHQSQPPSAPSDVTIVADDIHHRLDWPEDSLVNTADVRQRRSLSSFM